MLTIKPRMIIMFEHVIQYVIKMCIVEICSWSHTTPHTTEYVGNIKVKVLE